MAGERWHPGEHESRSCLTKHRYPTGTAAGKAKDAMRRQHRTGPATDALNVYRCQYCGGWHLGRPRKQRTLKNRPAVMAARQAEIHADW
jgi:hypothetical protein